jgi:hypothetical protein
LQSGCKGGICRHSASAFGNLVSMPIAALGLSGHCNGYQATVAVICNTRHGSCSELPNQAWAASRVYPSLARPVCRGLPEHAARTAGRPGLAWPAVLARQTTRLRAWPARLAIRPCRQPSASHAAQSYGQLGPRLGRLPAWRGTASHAQLGKMA